MSVDSAAAPAVMRAFLEEVWNAHALDRFSEFVSSDVRFQPPRGPARDHASYHAMAQHFLAAFSDLHFAVERVTGDAEQAAARLVITGTNDGPFRGRPATGRKVRVVGQPFCRVRNGKIVEFCQLFDELGMLHQLGHVEDATLL